MASLFKLKVTEARGLASTTADHGLRVQCQYKVLNPPMRCTGRMLSWLRAVKHQQHLYVLKVHLSTLPNVPVAESSHHHEPCSSIIQEPHIPVMSKEVIEFLSPKDNEVFIDMTFGSGGHTKKILSAAEGVKVFGLDRDPVAHTMALSLAKHYPTQVVPMLGRFSELEKLLTQHGVKKSTVDGILFDFGCSSMQMDTAHRGFSLSTNGPLDMRMDGNRFPDQPTGADVINTLEFKELAQIFKTYGEEKHARKIAQAIIDARFMLKKIRTTNELAGVVAASLNREAGLDKLERRSHVATKVFQALRIFVNNELNEINEGVTLAHKFLKPGGRLVALSFHSLEDRIVKRHITGVELDAPIGSTLHQKRYNALVVNSREELNSVMEKKWTPINKTVVTPSEEEVSANPRSRSAKLRAALKC